MPEEAGRRTSSVSGPTFTSNTSETMPGHHSDEAARISKMIDDDLKVGPFFLVNARVR